MAFWVVVPGRPYRGANNPMHNRLATNEVPEGAYLELDIEFPAQAAGGPAVRRKYELKQRC